MAFTGLNAAMGGQRGMTLILTNHSGSTCYVYGYPGLAFFSGSRIPLSTHLTWLQEPRSKVVLRPGGNAQALLTWRVSMDPPRRSIPPSCTSLRRVSTRTCERSGQEAPCGAATSPSGR